MNRTPQTTSPETTRAVIALGKASAEARRHASGLASRERGMAERLARTTGASDTLISLVSEAATAIGARELALSSVWPISAASRPSGNADCVAASRRALDILQDARLVAAAEIAALDPESAEALLAEASHALDLRDRLAGLDCDWRRPQPTTPTEIAAAAIEAFHGAGAEDARQAASIKDRLSQRQALLDSVADTVTDMLVRAGAERATVTQVRNVSRALAAMPVPVTKALRDTATLRDAKEALDEALARRRALDETISRIEARIGSLWKQEKPSKLASAADILTDKADARRAGVARYAKGIGVDPESAQAPRQLRLMAESLTNLAAPAIPPSVADVFHPLDAGNGALEDLISYADRGLAWRSAVDASESITHAIGNLLSSGRYPSAEIARFISETLGAFAEKEAKVPFRDLLASNRTTLEELGGALGSIREFTAEQVAHGKSAQRLLRELRLSIARMEGDETRPSSLSIETLWEGLSWQRLAAASLPASLDPRDASVLASFRAALEDASEQALSAERKIQAIGKLVGVDAKGWDVPDLTLMTRVHASSVALAALEVARRLVAEADGFHIVAALEEDSVPGERWEEYLASTQTRTVEEPRVVLPPVQARSTADPNPAFDFAESDSWTRTPLPGRGQAE